MTSNFRKGLIIVTVLLFPCVFWFLLIQGKNHFKSLEVFGMKDVNEKGDTIYHTIPPFSFINQEGKIVSDKDVEGKIYVANFFFATCPKICPKMNENLRGVVDNFKDDGQVKFLSFTVDPEHDSVPVLAAYAEKRNAKPEKWSFLTGNKDSIYALAGVNGYLLNIVKGNVTREFFHDEHLVLIDKEKRIRGFYDGLDDADVKKLNDEIKVLEFEYKEKK